MTLTVISIILLSAFGSSESLMGSFLNLIILVAVFLALATEFGFITP
jgi:hypothetical protein